MDRVTIRREVLERIARHAAADLPNECCGLLLGSDEAIVDAVPARNAEASPTRFLIDPQDHFAALRLARASALDVVGAYHSHPSSAPVPSVTDLAEANDPRLVHLIVSPRTPTHADIRAFRLSEGNFEALNLVTVE